MSNADDLLLKLHLATRRWHEGADWPWLELLRSDVTVGDYADLLVRMYGFEAPLEGACAYTPQLLRVLDVRNLRRAGLIAQDLLTLGLSPSDVAALPQCFSITTFIDAKEALGWLYVAERSTLHHEQARRHLQLHLPSSARATHYLRMFEYIPDHRQRFGKLLERVATTPAATAQVIEAALAGFDCLHQWFQRSASRLRRTA